MNTIITTIIAFAIGLAFGGAFFGTCTRAYDYERPRFGDTYMDRQFQQQQQRDQQYLRDKETQRKYPCP